MSVALDPATANDLQMLPGLTMIGLISMVNNEIFDASIITFYNT